MVLASFSDMSSCFDFKENRVLLQTAVTGPQGSASLFFSPKSKVTAQASTLKIQKL